MPDTTARLGLPVLMPSQAQKHVTHNEALELLDGIAQLVLSGYAETVPPLTPAPGAIYALGVGSTGAWAGQDGALAQWQGTQWLFFAPQEGWRAWDLTSGALLIYTGGTWTHLLENLTGLGVGTSSDAVNRLAVAAEAALFTHAGSGHQLKINKAASAETASLLYQSNWSGRAELGLTGADDLHLKVSSDGSAWVDALVVNAASGHLSGAAVQVDAADLTPDRLAKVAHTYGPGNSLGVVSQSGGTPTGALIEQGSNANGDYVRFADGTQVCRREAEVDVTSTGYQGFTMPAAFVDTGGVTASVAHVVALPNPALQFGNIQGVAAFPNSDQWGIRLLVAGTSVDPISTAEKLSLTAIGRWF